MNSGNISEIKKTNEKKSKFYFENLENDKILKIFDMIKKAKILEIAKINKKLQKILYIELNLYKESIKTGKV